MHPVDVIVDGVEGQKNKLSKFLYLLKAFNCVDDNNLVEKLNHLGIRGGPLNWLESYLSNKPN